MSRSGRRKETPRLYEYLVDQPRLVRATSPEPRAVATNGRVYDYDYDYDYRAIGKESVNRGERVRLEKRKV